jgi:hypothetical protein
MDRAAAMDPASVQVLVAVVVFHPRINS